MSEINFDEQFIGLSDLINAAIGSRPYPLDGDFIKPAGAYIAVKVKKISFDSWHRLAQPATEENGYQQFTQSIVMRFSVEAVRGNSIMRLTTIASALREPNMQTYLRERGMTYMAHTDPTDSSTTLDGVLTEDRSMMYIDFHAVATDDTQRGVNPSIIETFAPPTFPLE